MAIAQIIGIIILFLLIFGIFYSLYQLLWKLPIDNTREYVRYNRISKDDFDAEEYERKCWDSFPEGDEWDRLR
jgi:hypothetical protein